MAKQVGPQERKPEHGLALKSAWPRWGRSWRIPSGPAGFGLHHRPDIRLQPIPRWGITTRSTWQTGRCPYKAVWKRLPNRTNARPLRGVASLIEFSAYPVVGRRPNAGELR